MQTYGNTHECTSGHILNGFKTKTAWDQNDIVQEIIPAFKVRIPEDVR